MIETINRPNSANFKKRAKVFAYIAVASIPLSMVAIYLASFFEKPIRDLVVAPSASSVIIFALYLLIFSLASTLCFINLMQSRVTKSNPVILIILAIIIFFTAAWVAISIFSKIFTIFFYLVSIVK